MLGRVRLLLVNVVWYAIEPTEIPKKIFVEESEKYDLTTRINIRCQDVKEISTKFHPLPKSLIFVDKTLESIDTIFII